MPNPRSKGQVANQRKAVESRRKNGNQHSTPAQFGCVIRADESFSVEAFIARIGTTRSGLSEMRRRGLKARKDGGKRVVILGSDYLDYIREQPVAELDEKTPEE